MGYEHGWILARISRMLTGQAGKQQSGATRAGSLPGLKWREKGEKKEERNEGRERERKGGKRAICRLGGADNSGGKKLTVEPECWTV